MVDPNALAFALTLASGALKFLVVQCWPAIIALFAIYTLIGMKIFPQEHIYG